MNISMPVGVSSVTFTTAGVKAVSGGAVSGIGEVEGTQVVASYNRPKVGHTTNLTTGTVKLHLPPQITSITINGNVYAVTAGVADNVAAVDATAVVNQGTTNAFRVVTAPVTNP